MLWMVPVSNEACEPVYNDVGIMWYLCVVSDQES